MVPPVGVAVQSTLTPEQERFIHQWNRLSKTYKDWGLAVQGQFRSGRQQVRMKVSYDEILMTGLTESEFDALD